MGYLFRGQIHKWCQSQECNLSMLITKASKLILVSPKSEMKLKGLSHMLLPGI